MTQPDAPRPRQLADQLAEQLGRIQAIVDQLANPKPLLQLAGPTRQELESGLLCEVTITTQLLANAMIRLENASAAAAEAAETAALATIEQQQREAGCD